MRFKEYILAEEQLKEDLTAELHNMIKQQIINPFIGSVDKLRDEIVKRVAPRIKTWALEKYGEATKTGSAATLLKKLLNDPELVLNQLLRTSLKDFDNIPILNKEP